MAKNFISTITLKSLALRVSGWDFLVKVSVSDLIETPLSRSPIISKTRVLQSCKVSNLPFYTLLNCVCSRKIHTSPTQGYWFNKPLLPSENSCLGSCFHREGVILGDPGAGGRKVYQAGKSVQMEVYINKQKSPSWALTLTRPVP